MLTVTSEDERCVNEILVIWTDKVVSVRLKFWTQRECIQKAQRLNFFIKMYQLSHNDSLKIWLWPNILGYKNAENNSGKLAFARIQINGLKNQHIVRFLKFSKMIFSKIHSKNVRAFMALWNWAKQLNSEYFLLEFFLLWQHKEHYLTVFKFIKNYFVCI